MYADENLRFVFVDSCRNFDPVERATTDVDLRNGQEYRCRLRLYSTSAAMGFKSLLTKITSAFQFIRQSSGRAFPLSVSASAYTPNFAFDTVNVVKLKKEKEKKRKKERKKESERER